MWIHKIMVNPSFLIADDANASVNNGAEALDKAKEDLGHLANDASSLADQAKTAGSSFFGHAKGAAAAAFEAGSKAAENVVDEKLKEAENVRLSCHMTSNLNEKKNK